jgi:two-component system NarL family sensor kinase
VSAALWVILRTRHESGATKYCLKVGETVNLRHQIIVLAIAPLILSIATVTFFITWQSTQLMQSSIRMFEDYMLDARRAELLSLTNLALSSIKDIYSAAGPDDEAAKAKVRAILAELNYGEDGYFFVYDYDGNNIVHPRQQYREGHNWINLVDPDGDRVIAQLIAAAKAGGGLHQYKWEKPSTGQVVDKISFAVGLDKWRWMLGTGVYLDDVYAQSAAANRYLSDSIAKTFVTVAMIALPAVLIVFATCMLLNSRQRRMADGKLKELTQRIIDTQEEERLRLSRGLHDSLSQTLVGVRYTIDLARRKVMSEAGDALDAIERGTEALNEAIKEVRRISHDLRPGVLDDLGLGPALGALCHNFSERSGIEAHFSCENFHGLPKDEVSTALYRVAQEALTNVERHSMARHVTITLANSPGSIQMTIEDDGQGFGEPRRTVAPAGLGLRNMQERMAHFGGHLHVRTSSSGTMLKAVLPRSSSLSRPRRKVTA